MHKIYATIDKKDIGGMPAELFGGRIFTVSTIAEADKAAEYLKGFPVIGIDTETRPNFTKDSHHEVGLLQLSTQDTCFLFRLNSIGMPDSVVRLLGSNAQIKVGLSLKDDIRALRKRRDFKFGKYVELQKKVRDIGILDMSLQKIYANLFHKKISKNKRLTNWEAPVLTKEQKLYAATDAWACVRIYRRLEEFRLGLDYEYIAPMDDSRMLDIWIRHIKEHIKHSS